MTREGYKKHYALIQQWKDGAQIQRYDNLTNKWENTYNPVWSENSQYRITPILKLRLPTIEEITQWFIEGKVFRYKNNNALGKLESVIIDSKQIFIHRDLYDIETFCKSYTHYNGTPIAILETGN